MLPLPFPAKTDTPWWSYEVGLIHFIGMSTEHNYTTGSPQWLWLKNDLEKVDRAVTPWIIFGGHRAMYLNSDYNSGETSDGQVSELLIKHVEPLLYEHKVDLGFYGHNHVVQRHSAVYKSKVMQRSQKTTDGDGNTVYVHTNPNATVHMVIGTAGAMFTKNAVDPPPAWNELYFYEYGYARVTAVSASELKWEWINSESDEVMDRMIITQSSRIPASTSSSGSELTPGEEAAAVIFTVIGFSAIMVYDFEVYIKFVNMYYIYSVIFQGFVYFHYSKQQVLGNVADGSSGSSRLLITGGSGNRA
jgi:hypothetical protein